MVRGSKVVYRIRGDCSAKKEIILARNSGEVQHRPEQFFVFALMFGTPFNPKFEDEDEGRGRERRAVQNCDVALTGIFIVERQKVGDKEM